jgi:hypothetical protein
MHSVSYTRLLDGVWETKITERVSIEAVRSNDPEETDIAVVRLAWSGAKRVQQVLTVGPIVIRPFDAERMR